jgi:uncharacterized protein YyaL (SSP411 family)
MSFGQCADSICFSECFIMSNQNALHSETSPYLLQHADNPVHWYLWSDEALKQAKESQKPILLSIGYSACHWCHVMAHESFEDEATAAIMNEHFINIKVDREERPDLDKIYQTAHYMLTQQNGGWPLTLFLTPDEQTPFFAGTYFPKTAKYNMPTFQDVLQHIVNVYQHKQADIHAQNQRLTQALHDIYQNRPPAALQASLLDDARLQLQQAFDQQYGGFGQAPKFPHTTHLERLLRHWQQTDDQAAKHMLLLTLENMAQGGLFDQLGGGFFRYSVDDQWMIPHFEKMLYDNGVLLSIYAQAWGATQQPLFKQVCEQTADWLMREMQSPEGGYYSAYDADSEGEEGKYYVWTTEALQQLLNPQDYALLAKKYGLDQAANFEGKWHLHSYYSDEALAAEQQTSIDVIQTKLTRIKGQLRQVREQRTKPLCDEKILVSWNALAIKGMALAARHTKQPRYADSAIQALDFIRDQLYQEGRLLATYKDGKAHLNAYLDDYAYLLDAILEVLQTRWSSTHLRFAIELADTLLAAYEDKAQGGFWFVAHDHERLLERPKTWQDDALPNGNGVAAYALARLGYLLGNTAYLDAAERTIKAGSGAIKQQAMAHCAMLLAVEEYLYPPTTLITRSINYDQEVMKQAQSYHARQQHYVIDHTITGLPMALADKVAQQTTITYRCEGMVCHAPTNGMET